MSFQLPKGVTISPILLLGLIAVALAGAWTVWHSTPQKQQLADTLVTPTPNLTLGAVLSYRDGGVQYRSEGGEWAIANEGVSFKEGDTVRIVGNGRAIVTLDDGSAVRMNGDSTLVLEKLLSHEIIIRNDSGELYSRVVPLNRDFTVKAGTASYTSLGTAYKTINKAEVKGVEVYQSRVKVAAAQTEVVVAEGQKYLTEYAADSSKAKTLLALNADELAQNDFILWNKSKDQEVGEFKDKLGVLKDVQAPASVKESAPATPKATEAPKTSTTGISLSASATSKGIALNWKVNGVDTSNGFKVVRSESQDPSYPTHESKFVEGVARSTTWDAKDGKTYHFRVCIFTGDGCASYSNNVKVTAVKLEKEVVNETPLSTVSSITLSNSQLGKVQWSVVGKAVYGFKVVYSKNASPVYPPRSGDRSDYYGDWSANSATLTAFDGSGTYFVRVCEFLNGSCGAYSNQVQVEL
jgi:hypothetical protein